MDLAVVLFLRYPSFLDKPPGLENPLPGASEAIALFLLPRSE